MGERENGLLFCLETTHSADYIIKVCDACKKLVQFLLEGEDDQYDINGTDAGHLKKKKKRLPSSEVRFIDSVVTFLVKTTHSLANN